jgi:S1-C subfamily serine protease
MALGAPAAIVLSLLFTTAEPAAGEVAAVCAEPQAALAAQETELSGLFARVAPSVVLLARDGASGSGFVVGDGGLVLTNIHVVGDAREVTVQLADGRRGTGQVIARSTGALDLALVRAPFDDLRPLAAGDPGALRTGTFAATVGHGGGAAWTLSTGLIANPRPLGDGAPLLLAQMALRPGSSGGPLVDRLGRVVAVVTAGTRDSSGVTFAVRIDAAAVAFPQLATWIVPSASSPARVPPPGPSDEEVAANGDAGPGARPPEVARLSAESASAAMVTVWEAPPSPVKVLSARPRPARKAAPSHGEAARSASAPSPPPNAPAFPSVALLALAAGLAAAAAALRRALARTRAGRIAPGAAVR